MPIVVALTASSALSDRGVYERTRPTLEKLVAHVLDSPRRRAIGLSSGRMGSEFAVVALVGGDEVDMGGEPRTIDDSRRVVVGGSFRSVFADAAAYINRGDYAVAPCERDPTVALPQFAFSCAMDKADRSAWMQVLVRRSERILTESVADLLIEDPASTPLEYRARKFGPPAEVDDARRLGPALLEAINRVRAAGQLASLVLEPAESALSTQLAGTMIDADIHGRGSEADAIALGLLAGWKVGGTIRGGNLFVGLAAPTRDVNTWLEVALARPVGRVALLDPDARHVAIGPALPGNGSKAIGAVVTTYSLFESSNHDADVSRIVARVASARAARGVTPLARVDGGRELVEGAQTVLAGTREPMAVLRFALQGLAQRTGGTVSGYVVEGNDVDTIPIPDPLLHIPKGSLVVQVTHHRVAGAAWGQYVVFFLLARTTDETQLPNVVGL